MQKSLKIEPNISSTSTFPTIIPRCLVASLKSSAALSKSFLILKIFIKFSKHCSKLTCAFLELLKFLLTLINFPLALILLLKLSYLYLYYS